MASKVYSDFRRGLREMETKRGHKTLREEAGYSDALSAAKVELNRLCGLVERAPISRDMSAHIHAMGLLNVAIADAGRGGRSNTMDLLDALKVSAKLH